VRLVSILEGKQELDYILIPIPKQTRNILYSSETHKPITTTKQAFYTWQEKILRNLENHYGSNWETMLKKAIETEENNACKGYHEDTTGDIKR
jgi:hypothetical protein